MRAIFGEPISPEARMSLRRTAAFLIPFVIATTLPVASQQTSSKSSGARLEVTSSSQEAKDLFRTAYFQGVNVSWGSAAANLDHVIALDPQLGLARVFRLSPQFTPDLTASERVRRMNEALATMATATAPEVLLAFAWREAAAARPAVAAVLYRAAAELVPEDANVA